VQEEVGAAPLAQAVPHAAVVPRAVRERDLALACTSEKGGARLGKGVGGRLKANKLTTKDAARRHCLPRRHHPKRAAPR
jgi:hypothetical protein